MAAIAGCSVAPVERAEGPLGLVDVWRVSRADGESSWLRIEGSTFALWTRCGITGGGWDAAENDILFASTGPISRCSKDAAAKESRWLTEVDHFEPTNDGRFVLLSRDILVATLERGLNPPAAGAPADLLTRPAMGPSDRLHFLPITAAPDYRDRPADLIGVWVPLVDSVPPVMVSLDRSGYYYFYGACPFSETGRFSVTQSGVFLRVPIDKESSGCGLVDSAQPGLTAATSIAVINGELHLFERGGAIIERFRRAQPGQRL